MKVVNDNYCTRYSDLIEKEFNKSELEVASIMLNLSHPVVFERGATRPRTRQPWLRKSFQPHIFPVVDVSNFVSTYNNNFNLIAENFVKITHSNIQTENCFFFHLCDEASCFRTPENV